jgi:hypothetical protein
MCGIEVDEGRRDAIDEEAVAGTRITVTHDLRTIAERTARGGVVEAAQETGRAVQLNIGELSEVRRDASWKKRENLSIRRVNSEESRRTRESSFLKMAEKAMNEQ